MNWHSLTDGLTGCAGWMDSTPFGSEEWCSLLLCASTQDIKLTHQRTDPQQIPYLQCTKALDSSLVLDLVSYLKKNCNSHHHCYFFLLQQAASTYCPTICAFLFWCFHRLDSLLEVNCHRTVNSTTPAHLGPLAATSASSASSCVLLSCTSIMSHFLHFYFPYCNYLLQQE